MKKLLLFLIVFSGLTMAKDIDTTRLLVKTNDIEALGLEKTKKLFNNWYVVQTKNAVVLEKTLKKNDKVLAVQFNYKSKSSKLPKLESIPYKMDIPMVWNALFNDPLLGRVWAFEDANDNGVSVYSAYQSIPANRLPTEIITAVVDTGVDYNHEDLKDVMWINKAEIPNNNIDDDMNGYIDDVYGINTLIRDANGVASGDPAASHAHGTHVAGTIAATQNNGVGIAGIASSTKIMAIRTVPDRSDETDVDVVESFLYAAKHGAKLINCSFGKRHNEGGNIVNETITHIGKTYGTLTIAAAGNDSTFFGKHDIDKNPKYPASFDSDYLIVVASTTNRGRLSSFSNVGLKSVDIAAPGSNVYSTTPGDRYGNMSGTSMAAPTAVGVMAQVWSYYPELLPLELKKVMIDSVTKVGDFRPYMVSGGRVDLKKAMTQAKIFLRNASQQQQQD
jgi:thermitase